MALASRPRSDSLPDCALALLAVAAGAFYALCATPSLGFRDGPELVVTAAFVDIAHPAGFPTYNMLAKIATWLPLGSLGFRVTLFSALAGAASIFFLGLLLRRIHRLDKGPTALPWLWAALPFMALQQGFWAASIEVEVYTLNALFLVLLLYCAVSWFDGGGVRWLYAGGLLYGLACGNHAALALYLPVLLLLAFFGQPLERGPLGGPAHGPGRRIAVLAGLCLFGLTVYLLLLVRSHIETLPINFGNANTFERFWLHVTDAKDRDFHASGLLSFPKLLYSLKIHFNNLASPLFWPGLALALWGLVYLWRRYQILSVALIVLVMINMGFFFYWIDGVSAFLPSLAAFFILASLGLGQLGRLLGRLGLSKGLAAACALLAMFAGTVSMGPARFSERDIPGGFMAVELLWPDLSALPPESINLQTSSWFSAAALQSIYSLRPDVTVINWTSLYGTIYATPIVPVKFPLAAFPKGPDGRLISQYAEGFYSDFLSANISAGKEVFYQYNRDVVDMFPYLAPDMGYLFQARLLADSSAGSAAFKDGLYDRLAGKLLAHFGSFGPGADPPIARRSISSLYYLTRPIAELCLDQGRVDLADRLLAGFERAFSDPDGKLAIPHDANLNYQAFRSLVSMTLGRHEEAIEAAEKLVALDPSIGYSHFTLALCLLAGGQEDQALATMALAAEKDPWHLAIAIRYARLLAMRRSIAEAASFLDERAEFLREGGAPEKAKPLDYLAGCLRLPPETPDLPEKFKSYLAEPSPGYGGSQPADAGGPK